MLMPTSMAASAGSDCTKPIGQPVERDTVAGGDLLQPADHRQLRVVEARGRGGWRRGAHLRAPREPRPRRRGPRRPGRCRRQPRDRAHRTAVARRRRQVPGSTPRPRRRSRHRRRIGRPCPLARGRRSVVEQLGQHLVRPVQLVDVDVVGAQTAQARLHGAPQIGGREVLLSVGSTRWATERARSVSSLTRSPARPWSASRRPDCSVSVRGRKR